MGGDGICFNSGGMNRAGQLKDRKRTHIWHINAVYKHSKSVMCVNVNQLSFTARVHIVKL